MNNFKRITLLFFILTMTIGCDQISKKIAEDNLSSHNKIYYLGDTFRLQYVENDGAFLSLGSNWPISFKNLLLLVFPIIIIIFIFFYLLKSGNIKFYTFIALSLILGGGIGNLWDRVLNSGWVTDFMNIGIGNFRTGIFNLADVFIMCGYALLFLSLFNNKYKELS